MRILGSAIRIPEPVTKINNARIVRNMTPSMPANAGRPSRDFPLAFMIFRAIFVVLPTTIHCAYGAAITNRKYTYAGGPARHRRKEEDR
jgi:hypothetical protein